MTIAGVCPPALSIPSCKIWLDGNDPLGTGVRPADTTALGTLVNKAGFGNFIQGTGANQATYVANALNGNGGILFDGTNDTYPFPSSLFTFPSGDFTLYILLKRTSDPGNFRRLFFMMDSGTGVFIANYSFPITTVAFECFTSDTSYAIANVSQLNFNILQMRLSGGLTGIRVNNGTEVTNTGASITATVGYLCSQAGTLGFFNGTIMQVVGYDRFLTTNERLFTNRWLSNMGIAIS